MDRTGRGLRAKLVRCATTAVVALGALAALPASAAAAIVEYLVVANLLPLLPGNYTPVSFRFRAIGGGSWWIDDFYVDPRRTT
jgi:hypothetical protein